MTFCLNPVCSQPHNPDDALYCLHCGVKLLLQDRYRPLKLLGQGGFGKTFLATDLAAADLAATSASDSAEKAEKPTAEHCVIKQFLPLGGSSRDDPNLFVQEVARLEQLGKHPQLPKLLDHFDDGSARYLVQEYIAGENLETVLARGNFSETQIRQLLADLLPVLRFIHQHQVIHRDIKPANIIYVAEADHYALVDFGAAKSLVERRGSETMIGSAGYVAPEQAMGKATFASDLYSLGITCIHLLTGIHPFDLYSISEDRWIWRQYLTQPLSAELRRVLDRMLQRAISQRYADATVVLQALRLEAASQTAVTSSPSSPSSAANNPTATNHQAARRIIRTPSRSGTAEADKTGWRCRQTLTGHQAEVTAIALSPDGELIASGGADKSIRLWSLRTGELLYVWANRSLRFPQGHRDCITALTFSPNSEILISSSADGTIKQWDLYSGELFSTLPHGWGITTMALHPCQPLLVSGGADGLLQLWDLESEELIANLTQLDQPVTTVAIDPTGSTVWGGNGKAISQWSLRDDRLLATLKGHGETVTAIALSSDGCTLISGAADKTLKIWNLNTSQQQKVIAAHRDPIHAVAIHPTQPYFASASEDSTIKVWHLWTGKRIDTLRHAWSVNAIAFGADDLLISGSADETIRVWQKE